MSSLRLVHKGILFCIGKQQVGSLCLGKLSSIFNHREREVGRGEHDRKGQRLDTEGNIFMLWQRLDIGGNVGRRWLYGVGVMENKRMEKVVRIILWWLASVVYVRKCGVAACLLILQQRLRINRSAESISRTFNRVLTCMMRLQGELLKSPEPIPPDSTDGRWKWFKDCLGAIDGTHIKIRVPLEDKPRYRNRKGDITTNVLGVCSHDGQFIYVLPGMYYLIDAGFMNCQGYLTPYRGQRYHLNDWRDGRSPLFYPVRTHNRIGIACCLLHNLIRRYSESDLMDEETTDCAGEGYCEGTSTPMETEPISTIEAYVEWSNWRDNLANQMFEDFRSHR
ncbi:protein ALP1-like [Senna tora]|uniref:Protein ALP1-like n=1 Tax=Senna tora TaxID=362788 RepID=A0A834TNP5_9FABA|nr:protein ALP1-like [Senna tora]